MTKLGNACAVAARGIELTCKGLAITVNGLVILLFGR